MKKKILSILLALTLCLGLLPAAAFAEGTESGAPAVTAGETTVTLLTITDAICPINGEAPVTRIAETAEYTGTIAWEDTPESFAPKTDYTATITLTAKEGYTFTGLPANAFIIPGAKSVTNTADSGVITAVFQSPLRNYVTDGRGYAAYRVFQGDDEDDGYFDIINTYKGFWMGTTYSNRGYSTVYRRDDGDPVTVSKVGTPVDMGNGITLTVQPEFSIDGKFITAVYTLKNTGSADATVSVGSYADIQIGGDDDAPITRLDDGRGFKMVNSDDPHLHFNFFGKDTLGVTNVDTFWFGEYDQRRYNVFNQVEADSIRGIDSGMAYAWVDRVIPAGGTSVFRATMGTGDAASGTDLPIGVNFDTQGGSQIAPIAVASGNTVTRPADPVRSGYHFGGWYTEPGCVSPFDFSTPIVSTITLYAKWTSDDAPLPVSPSASSAPTYPVNTPDKIENGSVTVSRDRAGRGNTVTITVKPNSGCTLETLTVTDKNGTQLKLTSKGDGKYTFTMPASKVEINAAFVKEVETSPFSDVSTSAYYYEAVKWAQEKGITGGIGSGMFGPDQPCTRAQIVTFLWRAAGAPEPETMTSFSDVPADSYYAKAVAWAVEAGITTGTGDGRFSPDAPCTRAQSVTFLFRAIGMLVDSKAEFSDVLPDSYYANAVAWAVANGVTNGIGDGLFGPNDHCTRAQIVTFLFRAYQDN